MGDSTVEYAQQRLSRVSSYTVVGGAEGANENFAVDDLFHELHLRET